MRTVPRLGELYPGICLTTEEKTPKNLSQGSRIIRINRPNNKNTQIRKIHKLQEYTNCDENEELQLVSVGLVFIPYRTHLGDRDLGDSNILKLSSKIRVWAW